MKKSAKNSVLTFAVKPLVLAVFATLTMSTVHAVPFMVLTGDSVGSTTFTAASGNTALLLKGAITASSMTSTGGGNFVMGADTFTWRNDVMLGGWQSCLPYPPYNCSNVGGIPLYTVSTSATKSGTQFLTFNNLGTQETYMGLQSTQSAGALGTKRFSEGWGWVSPNHTLAAAIPVTASANYTGMAYGNFVNGTRNGLVESRAWAVVNYATRAIAFYTTGSVVSGQLSTVPIGYGQLIPDISTYAPGLNLFGTLTYAAGTNTFTGAVRNQSGLVPGNPVALAAGVMTGTLQGGFTGATANEMGGVFTLSNATNTLYEAGVFTASKLPSTVLPSTLRTPNRAMGVNGLVANFAFNVDPTGIGLSWAGQGWADYVGGQTLSNPAASAYTFTTDSQGRVARINQPNGSMVALYPMQGSGSGFSMTANPYPYGVPYDLAQDAELIDPTVGLLYSNIGVWTNRAHRASTSGTNIKMDWHAYGSITPAASLPLTGTANYTGVALGNYFDTTVASRPVGGRFFANASGAMNFATRTLALSTSGSQFDQRLLSFVQDPVYSNGMNGGVVQSPLGIGNDYFGVTNLVLGDAPGLNVSGTLTYVPASNNFSGTVSNLAGSNGDQGILAAGAMTGIATVQMNGPTATELSGVLSVKNAANSLGLVGALAAKQVTPAPVLSYGAYTVAGKEVAGTYTATLDALGGTLAQTTNAGVVAVKSYSVNTYSTIQRLVDGSAVYLLAPMNNDPMAQVSNYLADANLGAALMTGTAVGPYWADFNPDYQGNGKLVFSYSNLGIKSADPIAGAVANTMTQNWSWHAYGSATPGASIPVTASGTYYGIALGDYMNGVADSGRFQGLVLATANYATRAIAFATRGTVADSFTNPMQSALSPVLDLSGGVVANGLNISGTLNYAAATNSFTGTVSSAAGTMPGTVTSQVVGAMTGTASGQFNGPTANEMGGVFSLKNAAGSLAMNGAFTANKAVTTPLPLSPFNIIGMTGFEMSDAAAAVATAKTIYVRTDAVGMMSWLTDGAATVGLKNRSYEQNNSVPIASSGSTATGNILYEVTPDTMGWSNPSNTGWSYTLLGAWDKPTMDAMMQVTDHLSWHSVGSVTAGAAIPVTGSFAFNGIAAGSVSNGATFQSTMTAGVNFATRSISFATTGSVVTGTPLCVASCGSSSFGGISPISQNAVGPHMNGLDMTGTLTYAAGVNSFTGTVNNNAMGMLPIGQMPTALTGTAKGQFNGPTATEMGGVFKLSGTGYSVNGAFAGKR